MSHACLDKVIQILEENIQYIRHWDGRGLTKEQLEDLIGGIEWDLKLLLDLLKYVKKDLR